MPLTPLQERFCEEYLLDLNASQAAKRAGSKAENLAVAGHEFLRNPNVADRIAELQEARSKETKIDATWLLTRLAEEATADIADLYDENGNLRPVREWPMTWRTGLIQGIDAEELFEGRGESREHIGTLRKIKVGDRAKRLELIGRHVGVQAFKDSFDGRLTGANGEPLLQQTDRREIAKAIMSLLAEAVRPQIEATTLDTG